ncbi:FAD-dependent oxidoreductase [Dactylosporangium cerinum]
MAVQWDREVDVLVVGTGAAGMTAAIAAADAGRRVLVVESTGKWGGTTALSGGGLWMPTNPLMAGFGQVDSVDKALTYMAAAIGDAGPASSPSGAAPSWRASPRCSRSCSASAYGGPRRRSTRTTTRTGPAA